MDIITTFVGFTLGLREGNPFWKSTDLLTIILIKLFFVYAIAETVQLLPDRKSWWLLPIESALFVVWNGINILLVVMV